MIRTWMIAGLLFCGAVRGADTPVQKLEKAMETAREKDKLVLVQYAAHWCYFCKLMDQETLEEPLILRKLSRYEFVQLDYDQARLLAIKHGVTGIPSFVLLDTDGAVLKRMLGYQEPMVFDNWLNQAGDQKFLAEVRAERMAAAIAQLRGRLEKGDEATRKAAIDIMLEKLNTESRTQALFLRGQLDLIVAEYPSELLYGLQHERLEIRIEVANAYRKKFGEAFTFDPWTSGDDLAAGLSAAKAVVLRAQDE